VTIIVDPRRPVIALAFALDWLSPRAN